MKNSPLILLGLISTLSVVQVRPIVAIAQSLPDDMDVQKYTDILSQSLQILNSKKSVLSNYQDDASKLQSQINSKSSLISAREQDIAQLMRTMDDKGKLVGAASQENINMNAERERLLLNIRTANHDLDVLSIQIPQQNAIVNQITKEYNSKKSQLDQVDVLLNDNEAKIKTQKDKIAKVDADIAALNKTNSDLLEQKNTINTQINQTNSSILSLQNKIISLQAEIPQLQKDIESLNSSIATSQAKVPQLQTKLQTAKAQVPAKEAQVTQIQSQLAPLQTQVSDLNAQIQQTKTEINDIKPKLMLAKRQQNQQLIQQLEKQLHDLQAKLDSLKSQLNSVNSQIAGVNSNLSTAQADLDAAKDLVADLTKQIDDLTKSIQSMQAHVASKTDKIAKDRTDLTKAQQDLVTNQAKVTQLQTQLAAIEPQLAEYNQILSHFNQKKKVLSDELATLNLEHTRLVALRTPIYNEAKQKFDILEREEKTLKDLKHAQHDIALNRDRLRERVLIIEARHADNSRLIAVEQANMAEIQRQINGISANVNLLKQDRDELMQSLGQVNAQIYQASQDVRVAQNQVDVDNQKLQQVKAKYQAQFDVAYNAGASKGEMIGRMMGANIGAKDGKSAGISQGRAAGELEGELSSFQSGLESGLAQGKTDGYNKGKNAPANYQQGFELGYSNGKAQAENEAMQTSYRDARAQKKAELLLDLPSKTIEIEQALGILANVKVENVGTSAILKDSMSGYTDSNDAEEIVRSKISSIQSQRDREARKNADASRTPAEPGSIDVDLSQANCNSQPMTEFKAACLRGYEESFRSGYAQAFSTAWLESRNAEFRKLFDSAFNASKNKKTKQGYDEAYSPVSSKYEQIGSIEAQKTGFSEGKSRGYSENISRAQAQAITKGLSDEAQYFDSHGVLRLGSVGVVEGAEKVGLSPGSTALVDLTVVNFGKADSSQGQTSVQLIAASSNAQVDVAQVGIASIPSRTQALIHQFAKIKILPTAKLGEEVKIRLLATHSDGAREEKTLSFKVGIKMNMALTVSAETSPKIRAFLGAKKHTVKVQVQNLSDNLLNKDFTIIGSSTIAGIEFKTVSAVTPVLAKGQASTIELSYKIKDRGLKLQSVPLEFTVLYDGKAEVAKTSISVVPQ